MPPEKELPLDGRQRSNCFAAGSTAAYGPSTRMPRRRSDAPAVIGRGSPVLVFPKAGPGRGASVRHASAARTPIDAFVLARLEDKSLGFSAEADRPALIRRAAYDLLGLPPTPEQVEAVSERHERHLRYERLVDRLMASPHFGERWGRHWLDAAGYVDTIGDDTDAAITKVSAGKWLYRDYVINSFNDDKPFDRFLDRAIGRRRAGRLAIGRSSRPSE